MKCYKVVSTFNGDLISARCGRVQYKIGEFVTAKNLYPPLAASLGQLGSIPICTGVQPAKVKFDSLH